MNFHHRKAEIDARIERCRQARAEDAEIAQFLGQKLRQARLFRKMSQEELGAQLGFTFQQMQKYEKGTNHPNFGLTIRAARALNVPLSWFLEGLDIPEGGEPPLKIEGEALALLAQFDRIADNAVRRQMIQVVKTVADAQPQNEKAQSSKVAA